MLASLDVQSNSIPQPEVIPQNLPLQPHVNGKINGIATPMNDPFSMKLKAPLGLYGESGKAAEVNGIYECETPLTNGTQIDDDVTMDEAPSGDEAPPAPSRKPSRSIYTFQSEMPGDIPKMRSISTRSKGKAEPGTSESVEHLVRPTSIPISHKRTVSGQAANPPPQVDHREPPGAPQRRSDRLLRNRILPATTRLAAVVSRDSESKDKLGKRDLLRRTKITGTKGKATVSTVGRVVSGNRKPLEPTERDGKEMRPPSVASTIGSIKDVSRRTAPSLPEVSPQKEALVYLLEQYGRIGQGYLALSKYDCQVALGFFETVPPSFRETPWVLAQIGRAHFEKSSYNEAEQIFAKIKKMAPSRTEDMEIYSTVLWHLKKEVDLAYVSHELIETDRLSPQAWCALGNAFSLQGEHDQAVKCFRRATQLDPKFAYAFTLAGHEYVANEEFDKALLAYRHAISADNRHYNGWYGLGQVFERLGKYDIAKDHYINAAKINPTNPVLKVCIGLVLEKTSTGTVSEKTRRRETALDMYNDACELDPRSHKARFCKARVLLVLGRPTEAHKELEELKNMIPDDSTVHFLLGKIYRYLRNKPAALRHFTIATTLDPKVCLSNSVFVLDTNDHTGNESCEGSDGSSGRR
jgi:anaphase-promoting complex subunit 3